LRPPQGQEDRHRDSQPGLAYCDRQNLRRRGLARLSSGREHQSKHHDQSLREDDAVALMRVYCGLAASVPASPRSDAWLTAAVVDDAGRLLDVCDITDDATGYADLGALLAERSGGSEASRSPRTATSTRSRCCSRRPDGHWLSSRTTWSRTIPSASSTRS